MTYKSLDNRLANFEKTLNTLGYWPVISSISGPVRAIYGGVEEMAGSVACVYKSCQYVITGNPEHRNQAAAHYWYAVHGQLNAQRGAIEFVPIIGNLSTLFYDKAMGLRANYTYEELTTRILPIFEPKDPRIVTA